MQGDEATGLGAPDIEAFLDVCAALTTRRTTLLLAFEPRAAAVRDALCAGLHARFPRVHRFAPPPVGVLADSGHIEVYGIASTGANEQTPSLLEALLASLPTPQIVSHRGQGDAVLVS